MDEGAQVVIAGRSQASLHKAAIGLGAPAIAADVSQETDAARLAQRDEAMAINIRGTILCIKHCVPLMRARGGGSIINMSSLMGLHGHPMRSAYTATKFAVIGITEAVAAGLNPRHPGQCALPWRSQWRIEAARGARRPVPGERPITLDRRRAPQG